MRRSHSIGEVFTFGGRVPPAVGALITAFVLASVAGALGSGYVRAAAALYPMLVWEGQLWRLLTWTFIETEPLSLIFGAMMLYMFGRDLCYAWDARRFVVTFIGIGVASAAVTCVIARTAWPALLGHPWLGPWPVIDALIVAWAMIFPERQILLMFALPISGRALLWVTVGGTLLYAVFSRDFGGYVPHLVAQGLMVLYARGFSLRGLWQTLRIRQYERRARRRASHLKVIRKQDPPRWMN
jgi:membrane associated rhomboid family serine protease